ncbi:MAG TPA: cell division protein FtsZ, partial [Candidatus Nanoarchaeia archaeon]|nr:cell division protein FtsZ [Candidatus Nanoarchaeia archaeon]
MDYDQSNSGYQQPRQQVQAEEISRKQADLDIDEELKQLIASHKTRIKVVGCGGGGNNTINRITEVGVKGILTVAINTDAQDLLYTSADKKILIGKELTG